MLLVHIVCCLSRRFCSSEARPSQYGSDEAGRCGGVGCAMVDAEVEKKLSGGYSGLVADYCLRLKEQVMSTALYESVAGTTPRLSGPTTWSYTEMTISGCSRQLLWGSRRVCG